MFREKPNSIGLIAERGLAPSQAAQEENLVAVERVRRMPVAATIMEGNQLDDFRMIAGFLFDLTHDVLGG